MHAHCYHAGQSQEGAPAYEKFMRGHFNSAFRGGYRRPKYNVPLNVLDAGDSYEVQVFAFGFDKDQISIQLAEDVLVIRGKKELAPEEEPRFHLQEFPVKNFERQLALNGKVDASQISARHENGILKITLPKIKEPEKQNIPVG
jgi:HSP20 family protein